MGLRDAVRRRLHGTPEPPVDPNRPHAFKALGDVWVANGVPPASLAGTVEGTPAAIGAGLEFADRHCAVCRREEADQIHVRLD
jgi:hypothetical protein